MPLVETIQYAFAAGELSRELFGRDDLEKHELGVAYAKNYFVDYRGGMVSRPGFEFIEYIKEDDKNIRCVKFEFSPDADNTYIMMFGHNYIRFIRDGVYVTEPGTNITVITQAFPGEVTSTAHGLETGDWVIISDVVGMTELNNQTFEVVKVNADKVTLKHPLWGNFDTSGLSAYVSGGKIAKIFTITTPYDTADLNNLKIQVSRNLVRITHKDYNTYNLIRGNKHWKWTFELEDISNYADIPTGLSFAPSAAGAAGCLFAVTAVFKDGEESLPSARLIVDGVVNIAETAGSIRYRWNRVPKAKSYNVYRSRFVRDGGLGGSPSSVGLGMDLGYIGSCYGPEFIDTNIIPDFTKAPPDFYNPFEDGQIQFIEVTNEGTGYSKTSTVTVSDPTGSGFYGFPIVGEDNKIKAIVVLRGGKDYTDPSVSVSGGSGAKFKVTVGELTGNNPSVSAEFQQRQIYAATTNEPLTIWGSRPKNYSNFDTSAVINDGDSYEYDLASQSAAPILHLYSTRGGLLAFTQRGVWLLTGEGGLITPTNAVADPQNKTGSSRVDPLEIGTEILYIEGKGTTVRLLSYNDFSKVYAGKDVSVLSRHFFSNGKVIQNWDFADEPYKVCWCTRSDGAALAFTVMSEQNVYAWTQCWTQGYIKNFCNISQDNTDYTYAVVRRYINGSWHQFLERLASREYTHLEDAICVDSSLTLNGVPPSSVATLSGASGTVSLTTSSAVFSTNDVGKVFRGAGGKGIVTDFINTQTLTLNMVRDITEFIPETEIPVTLNSGEWYLDTPVTVIGGLSHLEGMEVYGLADGKVFGPKTVVNGRITLDEEATRVVVGLKYTCILKTLPATVTNAIIQNKRKRPTSVAIRLSESYGVKAGKKLDDLYDLADLYDQPLGEPLTKINEISHLMIAADWSEEGQVFIVQDLPLPTTVTGLVIPMELGDV